MKIPADDRRALRCIVRQAPGSPTRPGTRSALSLAVAATLSGAATLHGAPAVAASDLLGEVVVTARKREENLQDVPQSVDVFTSKDLQNLSITQFEDYATRSPSISFISVGPGTQSFFMRGVSDGSNYNVQNNSTTGFFLDDLAMSYYGTIPDLHMYDIERIEVLNGPQGTLFGAGSMSGAVRVITNKPNPNAFSAGVDADGGHIDGGSNNYSYEGFVNIPLVDGRTAVRLSAYKVRQGGFINNLLQTRQWVNGTVSTNAQWAGNNYNVQDVEGGRIALSQRLPADWELTLTGSYQQQKHTGAWDQDPSKWGDRNVARFAPEFGTNHMRALDLHLEGDVGIANLVYAAGYWALPTRAVVEYSEYAQYVNLPPKPLGSGVTATYVQSFACQTDPIYGTGFSGCNPPNMWTDYRINSERWSHELRLESKPGGRVHWIAGAYWEKTRQLYSDFWRYPGIQSGAPGGPPAGLAAQYYLNYYGNPTTALPEEWYSYKARGDRLQVAEFGDITFDLNDRWSVEAGVEHYHSDFGTSSDWAGYFYNAKVPTPLQTATSQKTNARVGVNYKAAEHVLLYASFAQGFRDGGFNGALVQKCYDAGVPHEYTPDTLNSFELGWKSEHRDGHLRWNGAVYYMPWKDYQTSIYDLDICTSTFNANIGDARVYGAESNVEFVPVEGLTLSASGSYNDSRITSNKFLSTTYVVVPGERLPYVPYLSFSASARYEWAVGESIRTYLQFDVAHKGDMWNDLRATNPHGFGRVLQPSYDLGNLRFGLSPSDARWQVEAYVSNLWNTRATIFVNTGNYDQRRTTNEPRVLGLRLKYRVGKTT
jgi:iron complex outermembrane recepter protein